MTDAQLALIARLIPDCQAAYKRYLGSLWSLGIEERPIVTYRSPAEQLAKYNQGRSSNKGPSWHSLRRAIDRQLRRIGGEWDAEGKDLGMYRDANFTAEREGFRQLGFNEDGSRRWIKTPKGKVSDIYHIEFRYPYETLEEALKAEPLA